MEPKKNINVDPKRNSALYFQLGLAAIAILSYLAIELKTYEKDLSGLTKEADTSFLDEDVPVTMQLNTPPPPPPPPPPAPEVIKIVEDKKDIKEVEIQSTETNQKEEVVKAEKVVVAEVEEPEVDVPFAIIEDVPMFPGCENVPKDKRKECFQEKIQAHIKKNFQYPDAAVDAGHQGKVFVSFIIEKDGTVSIANMRAPYPTLEKEARRIMGKLPKMTPGKQRGKPVRMTMSIPITFKLDQ
ncbi:energy transducer TonB [Flavobacterium lacus]|jgi:periplasmic protein TonB|uniref:Outer membrane transport energization protein TonB n=1 Tax=Flavobacterium lacus TaxID=1353778 RepID=A0A328WPM0_9FLAO|nr:energy transducer TonB [Flavobacterium lacus]RAR48161.1 outer membrane transport energization protein TonB [Flavobacterium lacus]